MASEMEPKLPIAKPFVTTVYKGQVIMGSCQIEDFPGFRCRDDDIWVCSFPRSGTTLTQHMTHLIQTLDFETGRTVQLDDRFPTADVFETTFPYYRGLKYIDQLPDTSPRFIKCHLPYTFLPDQLKAGKGKLIYITRNPKASVVSFYKILSYAKQQQKPTLREFVEDCLEGKTVLGAPWDKHFKSYWDHRNDEHVLFIQFEQLVKDRRAMMEKIAEFLGKELTKEDVDRVFEETSLESMKTNAAVNFTYFEEIFDSDKSHGGLINAGNNTSRYEDLPEDLKQRMDELVQKATKDTDITF